MPQIVIALTSANNNGVWYAPADCTGTITVEIIAASSGGGGGAYVKSTITGVTPRQKYFTNFVGNTWINTTNVAPTSGNNITTGVKAASGFYSTGAGGLVSDCSYNILAYAGGAGGANFNNRTSATGRGSGGAAGPNGAGGNGELSQITGVGGRGGSSNGRAAGYNGGVSTGENQAGIQATTDIIWTDFAGNQYGSGGGGHGGWYQAQTKGISGWTGMTTSAAASGGGGGGPGLIVITYTSTQIAGTYTEVFPVAGTIPWRVPLGVSSVKAEAIGGGGAGRAGTAFGTGTGGGGGGGAYAASNLVVVVEDTFSYVSVANSSTDIYNSRNASSWFNSSNNAVPTSTVNGVLASGGTNGFAPVDISGGLASLSVGDVKYDGGSGQGTYRPDVFSRGAGGGGAAGPGGAGNRGGKDSEALVQAGGGGGGGAAGGGSSTPGRGASGTTGGSGGDGPGGDAGGQGGNSVTNSGPGNNGSGGGGGAGTGNTASTFRNASRGGMWSVWTVSGDTYGPGGGGGGGGSTTTLAGTAGAGGGYGGGGGGGGSPGVSVGGTGALGLVVLTYTVADPLSPLDRYWVGGTGTWDGANTANWSTTSGGAGGAAVPTSANNVFFDANSNTGTDTFTVTIAATAISKNFNATSIDGAMTLAGSANLQVYGNFGLPATLFTNLFTGKLLFGARSTGNTINFNGKSFSNVEFAGEGGGWILSSALSTTEAVTLTSGTVDLNGFVLSAFNFVSDASLERSIAFNGGSIALTGNANTSNQTLWNMATATRFTYTGTPVVNVTNTSTNSGFTRTFAHGSNTGGSGANAISLNIQTGNTGSIVSISGYFLDLNFTGCSSTLNNTVKQIYGSLILSSGMTAISGDNTITFASTAARTITTNGIDLNCPIVFAGVGGAWQLQDNFNNSRGISLSAGSFDSNNKNITCGGFNFSGSNYKTLVLGTTTVTITTGNFAGASNNTTYSIGNSTIVFTTSGSSRYSNGSGLRANGAGTVIMAGTGQLYLGSSSTSDTCGTLKNTADQSCTFTLYSTEFQVNNFAVTGSEKNSVTINSFNSSYRTLRQVLGTINAYYLILQNTTVTGGATWNVHNSVDLGNNIGWNFRGNTAVVFTSSGTFTVPASVTSITAEAIGGGGGGGGGGFSGGGGAYAKTNILAVTPGNPVYIGIVRASDSWVNTVNSKPVLGTTPVSQAVLATAGNSTTGGQADQSIGNVKFSGGNVGAIAPTGPQPSSQPGSGGAAGPSGPGGNGGNGVTSSGSSVDQTHGGGGGGGANGGANGATATTANQIGGTGGNNAAGTGGGAGGGAGSGGSAGTNGGGGGGGGGYTGGKTAFVGANGGVGVIRSWGTYGPGGGSGGAGSYATFSNPSLYGGGGHTAGSFGLVVISYSASNGNAISMFL